MATIASLDIALGANSANLKKDLDRANKHTKKFSDKSKSHAKAAAGAFRLMAGALAGVVAAAGVGQLIKNADAMLKQADGAGVAFEAFQKLQFGLEQAGLAEGSLQKGMLKLNKSMKDAGKGTKTAVENFEAIGLSFSDLEKMSPEERFLAVAKGLNGIEDKGARAALAMELLGKEFSDKDLSGIVESAKGLTVMERSAAEAAASFNDAMNDISTSLSNVVFNIVGDVLPYITMAIDAFKQFSAENPLVTQIVIGIGMVGTAAAAAAAAIAIAGGPATLIIAGIGAAVAGLVVVMNNWDAIVKGFTQFLADTFNVELSVAQGWVVKLGDAFATAGEWAVQFGGWLKAEVVDAFQRWVERIQLVIQYFGNLMEIVRDIFTLDFASLGQNMKDAFQIAIEFFGTFFGETVRRLADNIKDQIGWALKKAGETFSNALRGTIDYVLKGLENGINKLVNLANKLGLGLDPVIIDKLGPADSAGERPEWVGAPTDLGTIQLPMADADLISMVTGALGNVTDPTIPTIPTTPTTPSGGSGGSGGGASRVKPDEDGKETGEETANDFYQGFSSNFASSLSDLIKGKTDVGGFLTSILDQFTNSIIDNFSTAMTEGLLGENGLNINGIFDQIDFEGLGKSLSDGVSSIFSSMSGAAAGAGAGGGGGFLGGLLSLGSMLFMSDGGEVPHTPYSKIGRDSVPTMLTPGEVVTPVDQVGKGGGSTVNINVTGDISKQTRREILSMLPQITTGVNNANKETGFNYG